MQYLNAIDYIQTTLIDFLRYSFSTDDRFTYSSDKTLRKIEIKREFPLTLTSYPIIVISSPDVDSYPRTYGNEIMQTIKDINPYTQDIGISCYISSGIYEPSMILKCWANTTKERELLTDKVIWYLRKSQRAYLENQGIEISNIRKSGTGIELYGAKLLYTNNVDINLFTQWKMIEYTNWNEETIDNIRVNPICYIGNTIILNGE